jgi:hypothetical protein
MEKEKLRDMLHSASRLRGIICYNNDMQIDVLEACEILRYILFLTMSHFSNKSSKVGPIEHIFTQNLCRRTVQNKG